MDSERWGTWRLSEACRAQLDTMDRTHELLVDSLGLLYKSIVCGIECLDQSKSGACSHQRSTVRRMHGHLQIMWSTRVVRSVHSNT